MPEEILTRELRAMVEAAGSVAACARHLEVPDWEIRAVLDGTRVMSSRLAEALGYERLGPKGRPHPAWRPLRFRRMSFA